MWENKFLFKTWLNTEIFSSTPAKLVCWYMIFWYMNCPELNMCLHSFYSMLYGILQFLGLKSAMNGSDRFRFTVWEWDGGWLFVQQPWKANSSTPHDFVMENDSVSNNCVVMHLNKLAGAHTYRSILIWLVQNVDGSSKF